MIDREEQQRNIIRDEFATHLLTVDGIVKSKMIAKKFEELLSMLELTEFCVPGRELAVCKTHLESACFYAKKAMAINPMNQQSPARC